MAQTFGQQIRGLRKVKQLTQRQLAELVEIDFTYLSKLENDREGFQPSEDVIRALAKALGADADELTLLAEKVPGSMQKAITSSPKTQRFLRKAGDLSDADWEKILEIAEKRRKKSKD